MSQNASIETKLNLQATEHFRVLRSYSNSSFANLPLGHTQCRLCMTKQVPLPHSLGPCRKGTPSSLIAELNQKQERAINSKTNRTSECFWGEKRREGCLIVEESHRMFYIKCIGDTVLPVQYERQQRLNMFICLKPHCWVRELRPLIQDLGFFALKAKKPHRDAIETAKQIKLAWC